MKLAILANAKNSFPKVMAEGLGRMLDRIGVKNSVFYNGLNAIEDRSYLIERGTVFSRLRHSAERWRLKKLARGWTQYNAIIIVGHNPRAFMRGFWNDHQLRGLLPDTAIVLYDLVYLGTRPEWARWLHEGNAEVGIPVGGNFGLERYDWYLSTSVVSEHGLPRDKQRLSVIGVDLDDGSLCAGEQDDFIALLDFQRDDHMNERRIQIQALTEAGVKWIELSGAYSISQIRARYRTCSAYFIAHRESFGLPICELQACGSVVFSPYADWCPSHWMKDDMTVAGPGRLSENFRIYENDPKLLVAQLRELAKRHDPSHVRSVFLRDQPQFYHGDLNQLQQFVDLLSAGKIHSNLHRDRKEEKS
jgi:hypothetical protein